ncbi:hypothetical protein J0H58_38745 [bacterium]|nr:hypothetical protein [bacterium]
MTDHDRLTGQFRRRVAGLLALKNVVAAATVWLFLWGTAVLLLRATQGTPNPWLAWGVVGVLAAAGVGVWAARRRLPDPAAVRAFLDRQAGCGGLLMAEAECDLGRWRVPAVAVPSVRWDAGRPLGLLAVALAYLALAFLLPADSATLAGTTPLDVRGETDRLAEQVRVLKEEKVIDPDRADTLRQKLGEVHAQAAAKEPAKTLEALDHLHDVVRQAARQSAEASARQTTKLDQVQTAADAVQTAAAKLDDKAMAALMAELSALAQKAAAEADRFKEELDPDLTAALDGGTLSKDQLPKLASAARGGKASIRKSAQKLYDSRLIDADQLKACEGGQCDGKGLADFLAKNGGKASLKEGLAEGAGRGGVTEGPGAAALQFGDRTSEEGAKFREEALPPAQRSALKDSQTSGVSKAVPTRDPAAGPPGSGALAGAAAGGGSATAAPVLPQHKAAVGRYFDRPGK